jgi:hypothetical protein
MRQRVFFCVLAVSVTLCAADPQYAGKWKMDPAKSDFGQTTITYASLPSGEWESTAEGHSYKFKPDGKDYPDGMGNTAAWKSVDASTWQTVWKLNGKVLYTDTVKLSADGTTLTVNTKGTKPNGEPIDDTSVAQRAGAGKGLAGKWQTKSVKISAPSTLELTPSAGNGMSYKVPAIGISCEGKLDGKDYPCSGATLAPGWTVAMTGAGPRVLDVLVKKDGKPFYKVTYTAGADGKSLTETGGSTATNEKVTIVYGRQ